MKKMTLALVAFMLVLGMTQCKKEQQPNNTPTANGETVYITMKVTDNGDKHIVYPGTGAVVYSNGDVIYVGNNGKYVGKLTYANGTFSGSITNPSTSDYLHFYFTGGKTPATNPTAGSTTSFTVSIADQSSKLPVLSYGHSTSKYIDGTTAYTCMLENQCGLVKFVPYEATSTSILISGMKYIAKIDFENQDITPTDATGNISLYSASDTEKWAILLPQDAVDYSNATVTYNWYNGGVQYGVQTRHMSVPAVTSNMYYTIGVPLPAIGRFTINNAGGQVHFSQGNLQYYAYPSASWRFADYQWDYIGEANSNIGPYYHGYIDLFGWGTSSWNGSGAMCYMPYSTNADNSYYGPYSSNLTGNYANADWGVYNKISNGGNTAGLWRTLTKQEWGYVFSERSTPSGIRYAKANVNGINGVILLPDSWSADYYELNNFNTATASYQVNVISVSEWPSFERYGAVFLPAAGLRNPTQGTNNALSVGTSGRYHSASYGSTITTYSVTFTDTKLNAQDDLSRCLGLSVRLVQDVQ